VATVGRCEEHGGLPQLHSCFASHSALQLALQSLRHCSALETPESFEGVPPAQVQVHVHVVSPPLSLPHADASSSALSAKMRPLEMRLTIATLRN
jgi:hypothetical protein